MLSRLSSQDTKFAQQGCFVTRLATILLIRSSGRLLNRLMGFLVVAFSLWRGTRLIQLMGKSWKLAFDFNSGEYQSMDVESLKKQLQLMEILVDGCKKHPAYRAIRPATGRCDPCVEMWQARQELKELEKWPALYSQPYYWPCPADSLGWLKTMTEIINDIVAQIDQIIFWLRVTVYLVMGICVVCLVGFIRRNLGLDTHSIELRRIRRILECLSSDK